MTRIFLLCCFLAMFSCERLKDSATGAVNSGAQAVGKTASDVVNNIEKGISESAAVEVVFSKSLKDAGLSSGKYYIRSNEEGNENTISLYLISEKKIDREVRAKLFDKKGVEMGRTRTTIAIAEGEAGYYDFVFDPKIRIEFQSKLIIE